MFSCRFRLRHFLVHWPPPFRDALSHRRVNKYKGPSPKEQFVVDRLLNRGPKLLFVSLDKADAKEFYDAVPASQKDRVSVYPINHRCSLVKWANTIAEYEAIDSEVAIVSTQPWYHDLGSEEQADLHGSFDLGTELEAKAQQGGEHGSNSHNLSTPLDHVNNHNMAGLPESSDIPAPSMRDSKSLPQDTQEFDKGLSPKNGLPDLRASISTPQEPHPPLPSVLPLDSLTARSLDRVSTSWPSLPVIVGVIIISVTSAALGGLLSWAILAFEPYGKSLFPLIFWV